jgi:hypothetical protein
MLALRRPSPAGRNKRGFKFFLLIQVSGLRSQVLIYGFKFLVLNYDFELRFQVLI